MRPTLAEMMADEAREQQQRAEARAAWESAMADAVWWPISTEMLDWLYEQEKDPDRAKIVLLAVDMVRRFPQAPA